jgi:hypothetical protein
MTSNITLLLSLDNYVYGVLTTALDLYPFNLINITVMDTTYLFGIQTLRVFATSKDIEDLITLTTNSVLKPLFLKDSTYCNVITTQCETNKTNVDCCIDKPKIIDSTQDILEQYDKVNQESEFISFCNDFLKDYNTLQLIEQTFESIQDADMMIQCNALMNDYVQEIFTD